MRRQSSCWRLAAIRGKGLLVVVMGAAAWVRVTVLVVFVVRARVESVA